MRRLLFLCGVLVLAGCSSNSFLGRRTDNFTAYYNTFYNARASFDEGVRSLEQRSTARLDRTYYLSLFPQPPRGGNQQFESAIVKSADVLREHPDSKWADDALLLIGQSYYYTGQFVGAEQKFREIIYTLAEQLGESSPLENEARFWLARTLISNEAYERAEPFLEETLARDNVPARWQGQYRLVQGELFVQQGRWDEAAVALRAGIGDVRDRDLRARAYLLLGQVEETREQYEAAVEAYRRVERFNPTYDLLYAAQLSAIRVEGQHGNAAAALEALRRMERDGKNYEFRAEIRFVRGLILQAAGRPGEALDVYDDVLYGGDGDISTLRGPLHYAIGTLYRDVYDDYFYAAAHFDTAATAFGTPAANDDAFRTPEAVLDAAELKATFGAFAEAMQEIAEADSLLTLGLLPPDAFAERIREIREQRARELEAEQRELERRSAQRAFGGDAGREGAATNMQNNPAAPGAAQAGYLSHRDPVRLRENRQAFVELWGDRPLVDNWRRSAAITGTERVELAASLGTDEGLGGDGLGSEVDNLPQVDLSMVPRTVETQAQMRTRRAEARYRLGNVLFLNMNRPDSAAAWYRAVIEEDGEESVAPRAYYALAEVQQALGDSVAAEALYRATLDAYPQSDFAGRIRERLGLAQPAMLDTSAVAEEAYERARRRWQQQAYPAAFDSLLTLPARFPRTETAPKALYAAGTVFLEWAARDTFDVLDVALPASPVRLQALSLMPEEAGPVASPSDSLGLPPAPQEAQVYVLDLFRLVERQYPGTRYAEQAGSIAVALDERLAARVAVADSIRAAEEAAAAAQFAAQQPAADPLDAESASVEEAPARRTAGVVADSTEGLRQALPDPAARPDTVATPPPAAPVSEGPVDPLRGRAPFVPGRGFTIVIGGAETLAGADSIAAPLRDGGYRVEVLPAPAGARQALYRVGVGQFDTIEAAQQAMRQLAAFLPEDAWVYKLR